MSDPSPAINRHGNTIAAGAMTPSMRFPFGLSRVHAIAELRDIADNLERFEIDLQKVTSSELVAEDDFALTEVTFRFAERNPHFDARRRAEWMSAYEADHADTATPAG